MSPFTIPFPIYLYHYFYLCLYLYFYYTHLAGKLVLMICMLPLRHEHGFSRLLKPYRMEHCQHLGFPNKLYYINMKVSSDICNRINFRSPVFCYCHLFYAQVISGSALLVAVLLPEYVPLYVCFHQSFLRVCLLKYCWFLDGPSVVLQWSLMALGLPNSPKGLQWQLTVCSCWLIVYTSRTALQELN